MIHPDGSVFFGYSATRASAACDSAADEQVAFPWIGESKFVMYLFSLYDRSKIVWVLVKRWFLSDFQQHLSAADPYRFMPARCKWSNHLLWVCGYQIQFNFFISQSYIFWSFNKAATVLTMLPPLSSRSLFCPVPVYELLAFRCAVYLMSR